MLRVSVFEGYMRTGYDEVPGALNYYEVGEERLLEIQGGDDPMDFVSEDQLIDQEVLLIE